MDQVKKLLAVAAKEIGVKESPPKSNRVKYVTAYGCSPTAWCCIFVWWCFREAGIPGLFYGGKKSAYCPTVHEWAKKNGLIVDKTKGRPGDIILFDWQPNGTADHIGIIEKVIPGGYQTIEGNWNDCVCRVQRAKMGEILAVIRPQWDSSPQTKPTARPTPSASADTPKPGDKVRFREGAKFYYPGGKEIPGWAFARIFTAGSKRLRGTPRAVECLLLTEIESSAALQNLEKVK